MKYFTIIFAALAAIYAGCGESTTGPEYTVVDELFFQKDYDSALLTEQCLKLNRIL